MEKVIVNQEDIFNQFERHLALQNNNRILFSGPFGTGKSTFISEYFSLKKNKCFTISLYPVNYSVAHNEDVFELIKFDLLTQLIGNYYEEIELVEEDFTLLLKSQMFIMERLKYMPLLYVILNASEKIGQPIAKLLKALESTVKDFKSFSDEVKIDEEQDINKFIESIEAKKGSPYENDLISQLIRDLVGRIEATRDNFSSILLIDDLDRLDPEHIFRLFNIFSSHDNLTSPSSNKFGFSKVIFICDIENVRKIFHHKYGQDVDFLGYIDKFYSITPFEFDNRKFVKSTIEKFISRIQFSQDLRPYNFNENGRFKSAIKAFFISLLDARVINLRMLHQNINLDISNYYYGTSNNSSQSFSSSPLLVMFYLLKQLFASFDILHQKLIFLNQYYDKEVFSTSTHTEYFVDNEGAKENVISYCLPFILDEIDKNSYDGEVVTYSVLYDCYIYYNGIRHNYIKFYNFRKAVKDKDDSEEIILNPYQLLLDTFEICRKKRYLR